jgi:hypothetical protein
MLVPHAKLECYTTCLCAAMKRFYCASDQIPTVPVYIHITVIQAATELKCACLSIAAFERLMGPCEDLLKERAISGYQDVDDVHRYVFVQTVLLPM